MRFSTNTVYAILGLVSLASAAPLSDVEPHSTFNSSNSLETQATQKFVVTKFTKAGNQKEGAVPDPVRKKAHDMATSFINKWKPDSQLVFQASFPFTGFDVDESVHFDIEGDPAFRACEPKCEVTVHVEDGQEVGSISSAGDHNIFDL